MKIMRYVITTIETFNTEVTMEFVKLRLLDEEMKISTRNAKETTSNEVSFKAVKFTCYRCGKPEHKSINCTGKVEEGKVRGQIGGRSRGNYRGRHICCIELC